MQSIIDKKTNQVLFGKFNEPINLNVHDYVLHNFFGKKCSKLKTHKTYHKFNFISVNDNRNIFAIGIVDVFFVKNIFCYYYDINKGMIFEKQFNASNRKVRFDDASHICKIQYRKRNTELLIDKNTIEGVFNISFKYQNKVDFKCSADFSENNKPLRVSNPADFEHWTYTEKCTAIKINNISFIYDGQKIPMQCEQTLMSSDWSCGYYRRNTNWLWASMSTHVDNQRVGLNFATFNNNALYPENAVWLNNDCQWYQRIIFEFNYDHPYENLFKVYSPDRTIEFDFEPFGQKDDIHRRGFGLIKTNFRQFIGIINGHITCNGKKVEIVNKLGLFEIHKSLW